MSTTARKYYKRFRIKKKNVKLIKYNLNLVYDILYTFYMEL